MTEKADNCTSILRGIRVLDGGMASERFAAGAQIVGGCCRARPAHVRMVAERARG